MRERKLSNGYISPYSLVRGIDALNTSYALSAGALAAVFTNPSWAFGLFFAFFAHRSPQALHNVLGPCGPYWSRSQHIVVHGRVGQVVNEEVEFHDWWVPDQ